MILAEITITYKPTQKTIDMAKITCSRDSYNILLSNWGDNLEYIEEFKILLLNRANKILGIATVGVGGVAGVMVDPKLIFQKALLSNASAIILAHNHPSGNLQPSQGDLTVTKKIINGSVFLDIDILDHLIVTPYGYYSFADEGMLNSF